MTQDTGALSTALETATRGHRSTLLAQAARFACKVVSVVVLARLVAPSDHGLYAMAASVVFLLSLFRDFGFGMAAVQAPSLDQTQMTTLLWTHLLLGIMLAVVTLGAAPFARWFYGAPQVVPLLGMMSVSFLFIGAGGFVRGQLARELRFGEINTLEAVGAIAGTVAMIVAGVMHAGAYSFAAFLLVSEASYTALAWRALRWRPTAPARLASISPLLRTGANLSAYNFLTYVAQQLDTIAIGRVFGAGPLGLYNRSAQLLALPNQHIAAPFTQVAIATLSRLETAGSIFRTQVCRTVTVIGHLTLPVAAVCVAVPDDVVRIVLGRQWPDAAPMLRWLAISGGITAVTSLAFGVNVATGQTRRLVTSMALMLPGIAVAIALGLRHGAVGVAFAMAVANVVLAPIRLALVLRESPVTISDYCAALAGPVGVAIAFAGAIKLATDAARGLGWPLAMTSGAAAGFVAIATLAAISSRLRTEFSIVRGQLPRMLPW
jgi:O-antigen/teichoic acid export membrane protein